MVPSVLFLGFCLLLISKILPFGIHSFGYTPCLKCTGICKKKKKCTGGTHEGMYKGKVFRERPGELVCVVQDKFFPNPLFRVLS